MNQLKLTQKVQKSSSVENLGKLRCQLKVKPFVKRPVGRVATLKKVRGFLEEVPVKAHEFEWFWPSVQLLQEQDLLVPGIGSAGRVHCPHC